MYHKKAVTNLDKREGTGRTTNVVLVSVKSIDVLKSYDWTRLRADFVRATPPSSIAHTVTSHVCVTRVKIISLT